MTKKPMQTLPDGTPAPLDPIVVMTALAAISQLVTALDVKVDQTSTALATIIQQQNAAAAAIDRTRDKAQDGRIAAQIEPVLARAVATLDHVMEALAALPKMISTAGQETRDQIAEAVLLARQLMYAIEDEALKRMKELRDEGVTDLKALGNTGRNEMGSLATTSLDELEKLAGHLASEMHKVSDLSTELMTTVSGTAQKEMSATARAATAEIEVLSETRLRGMRLMGSTVGTLEELMKDLRRVGPWLARETDRRTWVIAGATSLITGTTICTVAAVCLSAMMRAGVVRF